MSQVIENMKSRRSCRAYEARQVAPEALETIIEAGLWAPTGMGRQQTRFVVVQNPDEIAQLSRMNAAVLGASTDPFYGAPTVIVVLSNPENVTCVEDGALAIGNMLNAAHSLGVASCWIHRAREVFSSDEGKAWLAAHGVEGTWQGVGHCILGYAADGGEKEAAPRNDGRVSYVR